MLLGPMLVSCLGGGGRLSSRREKETITQVRSAARNVTGSVYQVHWIASTDSLAAFEDLGRRLEADKGYRALLDEVRTSGVFIGTSITDQLYEIVA